MRTEPECAVCFLRQAVSAAERFGAEPERAERLVRLAAAALAAHDFAVPPPVLGGGLARLVGEVLENADPWAGERARFNRLALELLPGLRRLVEGSQRPFEVAVRLAVAGNIVDFGLPGGTTEERVREVVSAALEAPVFSPDGTDAIARLERESRRARSVLYLADNAGEIVLDRLLVERLPAGSVTVAVRGGPALNDALVEDARVAGLDGVAAVVSSGAAMPGTHLPSCSDGFRALFQAADLVIAKGQGNYETLHDADRPVFFLLMAKCEVVARHLGCAPASLVVASS